MSDLEMLQRAEEVARLLARAALGSKPGLEALLDLGATIAAGGAAPVAVTVSNDVYQHAAGILWPVLDEHGREDFTAREMRVRREGEVFHRVRVQVEYGLPEGTVQVQWVEEGEES